MFTIHHYEQPNRYTFTTLRSERNRKAKRSERVARLKRITITILVISFFILALGIVGNNDLETELINQGYTQAEAKELIK